MAEPERRAERAAVLYVHGLWMVGAEAALLRRYLRRERDWSLQVFRYRSVSESLSKVLQALHERVQRIEAPEVHLIGHSLGGALLFHYLERYAMRQSGRVVFLGAPLLGSRSAQWLARLPLGAQLLGHSAAQLAIVPDRRWALSRELGIIAGTRAIGFSHLLLRFAEPNDGTVMVSETRLPGARAYLTMPVTHMGLLWSAAVAHATANFLANGQFES